MLNRSEQARLTKSDDALRGLAAERGAREKVDRLETVIGLLLSNSPIAGAVNRWEYTWRKANVGDALTTPKYLFEDSDDLALTGKALNVNEGGNVAGTLMPGVTIAFIPTGFIVGPVQGYVILIPKRLKDGSLMWFFDKPNPIDGICPEGEP